MAKTAKEAINNLLKDKARNEQMVFDRIPKAETKERQKVSYDELFERHASAIIREKDGAKAKYKMRNELITLKNYFEGLEDFDTGAVLNTPNIFKGLLVYGLNGTGKSMFFDIVRSMARELVVQHGYQGLWFSKMSAPWMVEEYMASHKDGYIGTFQIQNYYKGKLFIDDLGAEKLAYGKDELFESVLFERHRNGAMTYISTNLMPKEISERYGVRVGDRLPEYLNFINLKGKSLREE